MEIGFIWGKYNMEEHFNNIICKATGSTSLFEIEQIQSLWSGYGKIVRLGLVDSVHKTVVVKHIQFKKAEDHPRGWNTDLSHERKLKSYEVESEWYLKWSSQCDENCKVPKCFAVETFENEVIIVLEDLNGTDYCETRTNATRVEIEACLTWLADFHATFMHIVPLKLWQQGTYWHLSTRPDELESLDDLQLKEVASLIDRKLANCGYKTIVHGDAKLANFCFTKEGSKAAAVDFQYVGGGCGMKDVAYFLGSCISESECEEYVPFYLDVYFKKLKEALNSSKVNVSKIETELRELFPYAWVDFYRFLKGWSPSHWKVNSYSEKVTRNVVESIQNS